MRGRTADSETVSVRCKASEVPTGEARRDKVFARRHADRTLTERRTERVDGGCLDGAIACESCNNGEEFIRPFGTMVRPSCALLRPSPSQAGTGVLKSQCPVTSESRDPRSAANSTSARVTSWSRGRDNGISTTIFTVAGGRESTTTRSAR